eukprot:gene14602-5681_t
MASIHTYLRSKNGDLDGQLIQFDTVPPQLTKLNIECYGAQNKGLAVEENDSLDAADFAELAR